MKQPPRSDPMTRVLARFRDQEKTAFADAWVGLEPTFRRCPETGGSSRQYHVA